MTAAVAIAPPEPELHGELEAHLAGEGFAVVAGDDAPGLVERARPDLLLLGDPAALARWCPDVPVIVLGAPGAGTEDRLRAFRSGVDDWVDRPFDPQELVERIRAVLRRVAPAEAPAEPELVEAGPVRIEMATRRVTVSGRRVLLSQKELALLLELAREPERVFTKAELLRSVWHYPLHLESRTVDSHASRLRRKLREADPEQELVVNEWGVGYRLLGIWT